jgi:hypothetical protein
MAGRQAMTLKVPGQRSLDTLIKNAERDAALQGCLHYGPQRIYSGLLHHTRGQGWKDGSASHLFKDIFGMWPRDQDRGPPAEPPAELKDWIALLPKKSKR